MKNFLGQKILLLTAHPDDESYAAAGTMFENYKADGWNVLVCASYGEKGTSHLKKQITSAKFKQIRKKELLRAAKLLHIAPVHFIGVPDGKIKQNKAKIFNQFIRYAKKYKPQVILGYGKDGISGHHDHIAVGDIASKVARKLKIPYVAYTLPPRINKMAEKYLKSRRRAGHYINKLKFTKALGCHKSQMDGVKAFTGFPKFAVKELLKSEYFVINKKN